MESLVLSRPEIVTISKGTHVQEDVISTLTQSTSNVRDTQFSSIDRDYSASMTEYINFTQSTRGGDNDDGAAAMDVDDEATFDESIDRDYGEATRDFASACSQEPISVSAPLQTYEHTTDLGNDRHYGVAAIEIRKFRAVSASNHYESVGDGDFMVNNAGDRDYDVAQSDIARLRFEHRMAQISEGEIVDASNDRPYDQARGEIHSYRVTNQEHLGLVLGDGHVCQLPEPASTSLPVSTGGSTTAATDACNDRNYGTSCGGSSSMVMTALA